MKKNRLLSLFPLLASLALSSCDILNNLNFNGPRKRSSGEVSSKLVEESSEMASIISSSNTSSSSVHIHEFGDYLAIKEPTCTERGKKQRECSICGRIETVDIDPMGHDWQDVPQEEDTHYVPATSEESGQRSQRCSRCHEEQIVVVPYIEKYLSPLGLNLYFSDNNHLFIQLHVLTINYSANDIKYAFALQRFDENQAEGGEFIYGSDSPQGKDFNIIPTLIPSNYFGQVSEGFDNVSEFYLNIDLTEIFKGRLDSIVGGFIPCFYRKTETGYILLHNFGSLETETLFDDEYRYFIKNDDSVNRRITFFIEELPPFFHYRQVQPYIDEDSAWIQILGEALDQTKTVAQLQAELDATNVACRFQREDNTFITRSREEDTLRLEAFDEEGIRYIAVWIDVQFMLEHEDAYYNTHLNLDAHNPIDSMTDYCDCRMETDFDFYVQIGTNRNLFIFSHPEGQVTLENSYCNLGFRVHTE